MAFDLGWCRHQTPPDHRTTDMSLSHLGERLFGWIAGRIRYSSSLKTGDYADWEAARNACRSVPLAAQVSAHERAYREVREGRARYERDSLLKIDRCWDWPLLTALAEARADGVRRATVLDIGGGLASVFHEHRDWLEPFDEVRWHIVERPEVISAGQRLVDDPRVRFFDSIPAAMADGRPDVVIGSGLLGLVPDPYGLLAAIAGTNARRVFLDRIPLLDGLDRDLITRQVVPRSIYESESPFWFFDATGFRRAIEARFSILGEWTGPCDRQVWVRGRRCHWSGFLLAPIDAAET